MAKPTKHIVHQGPVLASLGETVLSAALQRFRSGAAPRLEVPSAEIRQTLAPRAPDLVKDYIRHVGGDPSSYKGVIPAHMWPQWGFALAAKTLKGIPYPMARVLNGGCRMEINAPLPLAEQLHVTARLEDIDDNGKRAVLHQKVVTGTATEPEALVSHLYAIVPLGGGKEKDAGAQNGEHGKAAVPQGAKTKAKKKEKARVPVDVEELAFWRLPANAGLHFAMLTGDFNPVHWIRPYAKAFGFKSTILHGFSSMARSYEGIQRTLFAGRTDRICTYDVKFTRPLVLPAKVGLYIRNDEVYVGDAPGGPAYLVGSYTRRQDG